MELNNELYLQEAWYIVLLYRYKYAYKYVCKNKLEREILHSLSYPKLSDITSLKAKKYMQELLQQHRYSVSVYATAIHDSIFKGRREKISCS